MRKVLNTRVEWVVNVLEDRRKLLRNYIDNLYVNTEVAAYTHCKETWRDIDYTPEYNKFYFIVEGEGWLKIGDREYYPKPGQLFLMPAGVKQSYSAISENPFKKYWCHFAARVGDKNLFDILKAPHFIQNVDVTYLTTLFSQMDNYLSSNDLTASIRSKSVLLEVIAYFLENTVVEEIKMVESKSIEKLNAVMVYIENHLEENITVEQMASMLHFHPNYFIRFFKNHLGSSPVHYILKRRMQKAKNLLLNTEMSITEVARSTGYKDLFHFSRSFKGQMGLSPTEFREARHF